MDIIDPMGSSVTEPQRLSFPKFNQYAITGFSPRVKMGDTAVVFSQFFDKEPLRIHYFVIQLQTEKPLELVADSPTYAFSFMLEGSLVPGYNTPDPLPQISGHLQLLEIPAGSWGLLGQAGVNRWLVIELELSFLQQLMDGVSFVPDKPAIHLRAYNDAAASITVKMTHTVIKLLNNKKEGLIGNTLIDIAAKELILQTALLLEQKDGMDKGSQVWNAERMEEVKRFILRNLETRIAVPDICKEMGISKSRLYEGFKRQYGISIHDFINQQKAEKAKLLLRDGVTVREVATRLGYEDVSNFSRMFKRCTGTTPTAFQFP